MSNLNALTAEKSQIARRRDEIGIERFIRGDKVEKERQSEIRQEVSNGLVPLRPLSSFLPVL